MWYPDYQNKNTQLSNFRETKAAGAHPFKVGVRERLLFE